MFCTHCGKEIKDGSKFCTHCGNSVVDNNKTEIIPQPIPAPQPVPVPQPAPAPQPVPTPQPQPTPVIQPQMQNDNLTNDAQKNGKNIGLLIAGIIAALALIVALVFAIIFVLKGITDDSDKTDSEKKSKKQIEEDASTDEDIEDESSEESGAESEEELDEISILAKENDVELMDEKVFVGHLQREILTMNSQDYQFQKVNVFADNYTIGARDTSAVWDRTLFYTLEGYENSADYCNKNICNLEKKETVSSETNNIIDYEIYTNPVNNKPNKIVSIEYLSNGIEVVEYYYTNDGKINFIFKYSADNYVSSYATPDKDGERFLFNNDSLLTWRVITNGSTMNYCYGTSEAERNKKQWGNRLVTEHADFNSTLADNFSQAEKNMLNAAYNTYNIVTSMEGIARIQGTILDNDSAGLADAVIELYDDSFQNAIFKGRTDKDGKYVIYVPTEDYTYNIRAYKDDMTNCDIYGIGIDNGQIGAYQDTAYLMSKTASKVKAYLTLGDAFNSDGNGMLKLKNASVKVRMGINNYNGEVIYTGSTDTNGYIVLELQPDVYTIEVNAAGYETMYYTIVLRTNYDNTFEFYAAPELGDTEYAIVLTWGYTPSDLDSHLFTTKGSASDHIWYGDQYDDFNNYLDVDDTSSFGPETVTIRSFSRDDYYKYCVVDFTNCAGGNPTSYEMSMSGATVNVYSTNGLVGTYHVPTNTSGVIWEVFEIRNGILSPIQRYYNNVSDKEWWHGDK